MSLFFLDWWQPGHVFSLSYNTREASIRSKTENFGCRLVLTEVSHGNLSVGGLQHLPKTLDYSIIITFSVIYNRPKSISINMYFTSNPPYIVILNLTREASAAISTGKRSVLAEANNSARTWACEQEGTSFGQSMDSGALSIRSIRNSVR